VAQAILPVLFAFLCTLRVPANSRESRYSAIHPTIPRCGIEDLPNLQFRANSLNSRSRASIVFHSANPISHFGQISKYTNSPSVSAPNRKFGATLHVEQTNITAPLRAFIPDK
jgi:hypothetical protein